jgi:hypothetical protein
MAHRDVFVHRLVLMFQGLILCEVSVSGGHVVVVFGDN